jgi:hypothetical protein
VDSDFDFAQALWLWHCLGVYTSWALRHRYFVNDSLAEPKDLIQRIHYRRCTLSPNLQIL